MTNPRTKYTEECRRETADCLISTERPVSAVASELGIHQKTAARWVTARKKVLNGDPYQALRETTTCVPPKSASANLRWKTPS